MTNVGTKTYSSGTGRIKVGLVTTPMTSGHAVRGIGFYTRCLLENLKLLTKKKYGDFEIVSVSETDLEEGKTAGLSLVHYPFFDLFCPTLKVVDNIPTVVTIHDVVPLRFPEHYPPGVRGGANLFLQKQSLKRVRAVITDSEASKEDIVNYLGVPPEKITVVPLAPQFDPKRPISRRQKLSVRKGYNLPEKFVLYVGDINWNKNVLNLAKACRKAEVPLVIVGKQAKELDGLMEGSRSSSLRDVLRSWLGRPHPELAHLSSLKDILEDEKVIRLGFVPGSDLPVIYSLASVYCQPSFWEGFGLGPLEAMTAGCPVVSSDTPALRELLGEAAIFVDPTDSLEIAKGIEKVLEPGEARRLVLLGRQRTKSFSWRRTAAWTLEVYKSVMGTGGGCKSGREV